MAEVESDRVYESDAVADSGGITRQGVRKRLASRDTPSGLVNTEVRHREDFIPLPRNRVFRVSPVPVLEIVVPY